VEYVFYKCPWTWWVWQAQSSLFKGGLTVHRSDDIILSLRGQN